MVLAPYSIIFLLWFFPRMVLAVDFCFVVSAAFSNVVSIFDHCFVRKLIIKKCLDIQC
jgi:hypothetical protein